MKLRFAANVMPFILLLFSAGLAGCSPAEPITPTLDLQQAAAAQATAIVQRAQATALIRQAQTQEASLLAQPATPTPVPAQSDSAASNPAQSGVAPTVKPISAITPNQAPVTSPAGQLSDVRVLKVSYASEGLLIDVQFMAPPDIARLWMQGKVYIIDEATGTVYDNIPAPDVIGPLFARPKQAGQLGYVMFTNTPPGLPLGSLVTVVLGDFKVKHVVVQN